MIAPNVPIKSDSEFNRLTSRIVSLLRYILRRFFAISITVLLGVFLTVVIANRSGMIDETVQAQVNSRVRGLSSNPSFKGDLTEARQKLEASEGLSLSFWPKHFRYTLKALMLDWGNVMDRRKFFSWIETPEGTTGTADSRTIILSRLSETLLLSGTAFLLLALIGIPIALYLSQREGNWLDILFGVLTPLSTVPSWVIGILLVLLFSVQFKLFPPGKMIDSIPPQTWWETVIVVSYHMVLPVMAVILSLLFQLVYNWRTYLLIYSGEDYVMLAKAKGLKEETVNFHYVLRPSFPYILTNLGLTLVGFWQMTAALEFFFQWPGIGKLFVDALPSFHTEAMYPGEISIVVGIIVLFAYLLGITVFVLDFLYLIIDPRMRVETPNRLAAASRKQSGLDWVAWIKGIFRRKEIPILQLRESGGKSRFSKPSFRSRLLQLVQNVLSAFSTVWLGLREVLRVPAAAVGMVLVLFLLVASIAVLIFVPYDPVARQWASSGFEKQPKVAKLALPLWVNWFREADLSTTRVFSQENGGVVKQAFLGTSDSTRFQFDVAFNYSYQDFPSDIALYLPTRCKGKSPFVSVFWTTPDGREIALKSTSVPSEFAYPFSKNIPVNQQVSKNASLKKWFITSGANQTPDHYLLFADPNVNIPKVLPGTYMLRIEGFLFEKNCDIDAEFVLFGRVQGWSGTDYLRRDLSIPLLWGLPLALATGLVGAVTTSILSLFVAAFSAWMGGWVDAIVQRATEVNLILPVMGLAVLLFAYFQVSLWAVIGLIILSNVFGNSTKAFRAALIQEKKAGYVEAARMYGASSWRIISQYLVRRMVPVIIPQMVLLIPGFIFLEATLAIFNIVDPHYPTWGRMVYSALRNGGMFGSEYWVLQPIAFMLFTSLAFVLISFGLNRVLNPQLRSD